MSLHAKLLALLSTPAARAASDADTRRAVERALDLAPPTPLKRPRSIALDFDGTIFGGKFTEADEVDGPPVPGAIAWLSTQLAAGVVVTIHTCRLTPINPDCPWPTVHEQATVRAAISGWLQRHIGAAAVEQLRWWTHPGKPHCDIYLDDKAVRFEGVFPTFDDRPAEKARRA